MHALCEIRMVFDLTLSKLLRSSNHAQSVVVGEDAMKHRIRGLCLFIWFCCNLTAGLAWADEGDSETARGKDVPRDFVYASGQQLLINGRPFYFQGTNLYDIGLLNGTSEWEVEQIIKQLAWKGIRVIRMWGFNNGGWNGSGALQWSPGQFNEEGLRRIDWAVAKAADYGIRIIFVFGNFEDEYGGIQWWVDRILGGGDKEKFFTDWPVRKAFMEYMKAFIHRRNSVNGRIYRDDPTIMAWELLNEPHTTDNYERQRGLPIGQIVFTWLWEMSHFVKSQDPHHMVATGEEGYRVDGWSDRHNWINDGTKGADFVRNIQIPTIDFVTLHIYAENWAIPYWDRGWLRDYFLSDRVAIAHRINNGQGKPVVLEEYGAKRDYYDRNTLFREFHQHANKLGIVGTVVWRVSAQEIDDVSYEFDFGDAGAQAVQEQAAHMNSR
jgi:mannan endo-1,4-beta-mannosidase